MTELKAKFINHKTQKEIKPGTKEYKDLQKELNAKPTEEVEDKFDFFGIKKDSPQKKYGMKAGGFTKKGGMYY